MIAAITGGTGFIGRHLIARHIARGDEVRYLTRREPANAIRGATPCVGDLSSAPTQLRSFADGADVLYHCAAELRDESSMQSTNVQGTANLLAAANGRIGRWVQLSSTGIYGEQPAGDVDETAEPHPANAYEKSKTVADGLITEAARLTNLPCVIVRPSNVYGTDMPNQSLFQWIRMVDRGLFFFIGSPGAIANYIHVENVIDALLLCAESRLPANARAYIVSDYRPVEEFVGIIAAALGKERPNKRLPEALVRAGARVASVIPRFPLTASRIDMLTNRIVFRTDRIASELGYKQKISVEEGISELTRYTKRGSD